MNATNTQSLTMKRIGGPPRSTLGERHLTGNFFGRWIQRDYIDYIDAQPAQWSNTQVHEQSSPLQAQSSPR